VPEIKHFSGPWMRSCRLDVEEKVDVDVDVVGRMWMCSHISRVISTRVLLVDGDGGWWWFLRLGMGPFGEGARAQSGSVKCCP